MVAYDRRLGQDEHLMVELRAYNPTPRCDRTPTLQPLDWDDVQDTMHAE